MEGDILKIGIDCGHTLSGADYGAVGIKAESNLTREVGTKVISKLRALGHTVIPCYKDTCSSLGDSLSYRSNTANSNNVDLFASIHFNAFNGSANGTEVYTYGGKELPEARRVLNNLASLGFYNRGLKNGSNLAVVRNTRAKAMLIEVCFCDSPKDMGIFDSEKVADAICKGLVGTTISNKEDKYIMDYIVIYNNGVDQRSAEYLADFLQCPTIANDRPFDYSKIKHVYAVGYDKSHYTSYCEKVISGNGRYETMKAVHDYIRQNS